MGISIIEDRDNSYKALYCTTTMQAFGPIFYEEDNVELFLKWSPEDPRTYSDAELEDLVAKFRNTEFCKECEEHEPLEGMQVCEQCHEDYLMTKGCDDYHAAKDEGRLP